jgi:hypothetical protein
MHKHVKDYDSTKHRNNQYKEIRVETIESNLNIGHD